jgi:ketosteroid isomerase-like protein
MKALSVSSRIYSDLLDKFEKIENYRQYLMTRSTKRYSKNPYINWSFPFLLSFMLIVGMTKSSHAQDVRDIAQNLPDRENPSESPKPSIIAPENLPGQVNPSESPNLPVAPQNSPERVEPAESSAPTDVSQNAPEELKDLIAKIDAAANQKDSKALMQFYSPEFTNSDGLTSLTMPQALSKTWNRYPQLTYQTQIISWEKKGDELVAETVTNIRGQQKTKVRSVSLNSKIQSRQSFKDQKLLKQEIISEKTEMTSGVNPPQVDINLPDTVKVGSKFDFDAIVKEPLNDEVLLGTAIEDKVSSDRYLDPKTLELEALPAGGIFKTVTAPIQPENRWFSAILIRGDGITMVTQRLRVEK